MELMERDVDSRVINYWIVKGEEGEECDLMRDCVVLYGVEKKEVEELIRRVKKGIEFLDSVYGSKWGEAIDLDYLDMSSAKADVCGQIEGYMWLLLDKCGRTYEDAVDMGFALPLGVYRNSEEKKKRYEVLTDIWKWYIKKRKGD